ncbi:MAG: hypothetical protein M3Z85_00755 [Acidobacteriota bacterium]|nr:hypothetical protein [Acidobacteriota bacterium]
MALLPFMLCFEGCGGPTPKPPATEKVEPKAPADETALFPFTDLIDSRVVPDRLLGKSFLPGGTIADYKAGYQLFAIRMESAQKASFVLLDFRKDLANPKYLAHMGGFFGLDRDKPLYVFAKGPVVAGVVGLPYEKADIVARQFAVKIR